MRPPFFQAHTQRWTKSGVAGPHGRLQRPWASAVTRVGERTHVGTPRSGEALARSHNQGFPTCAARWHCRDATRMGWLCGGRESPGGPAPCSTAGPWGRKTQEGRTMAVPRQGPGGVQRGLSLLSSTSSCICELFKKMKTFTLF